jgi:hypothetical protein
VWELSLQNLYLMYALLQRTRTRLDSASVYRSEASCQGQLPRGCGPTESKRAWCRRGEGGSPRRAGWLPSFLLSSNQSTSSRAPLKMRVPWPRPRSTPGVLGHGASSKCSVALPHPTPTVLGVPAYWYSSLTAIGMSTNPRPRSPQESGLDSTRGRVHNRHGSTVSCSPTSTLFRFRFYKEFESNPSRFQSPTTWRQPPL